MSEGATPPRPTPPARPPRPASVLSSAPKETASTPAASPAAVPPPAASTPASSDTTMRDRVIQELIMTEQTYVQRLEVVVKVYIEPMRAGNVLKPDEMHGQFGCLEQIATVHRQFLQTLESTPFDNIGSVMNTFCGGLTMYQPYLLIFESSLRKRAKLLLSNKKFNEIVELARVNPLCCGLSMESLLVLPVQRIPRYKMLLDEMKKQTITSHPDYENICAACETIKAVATENNEAFHIREAEEKVYEVMTLFDPKVDLLDVSDRRLIKSGPLQKQCRRGLKDYHFWLFSDILIYGSQNTGARTFKMKHKLNLKDTVFSKGVETRFNGCDMIIQSAVKSFFTCASSITERDEWFNECSTTRTKYLNSLKASGQDVSGAFVAPIWRPDDTSGLCGRCNAEFTTFFRRHHCRKCGLIVCDNCSKDRVVLANINKGKPVRVCATCKSSIDAPARPPGGGLTRRVSVIMGASKPSTRPPMPLRKPPVPGDPVVQVPVPQAAPQPVTPSQKPPLPPMSSPSSSAPVAIPEVDSDDDYSDEEEEANVKSETPAASTEVAASPPKKTPPPLPPRSNSAVGAKPAPPARAVQTESHSF